MMPTNIKLIVLDADGVLTDGSIQIDDLGRESKRFYVRDGFAISAAQRAGLKVAVLTSRSSRAVTLRMAELGVGLVMQAVRHKQQGFETICQQADVLPEDTAYVGDDLVDLPCMMQCGYPIAVGDAVDEVRLVAKYVTQVRGGRGAVREAIEHILKAQGKWDEIIERYEA